MDVAARITSKGQVTIPKAVRDALGLKEGDRVVFRVEGRRAFLARTADLLDLAEAVSAPASKRGHLRQQRSASQAELVDHGELRSGVRRR